MIIIINSNHRISVIVLQGTWAAVCLQAGVSDRQQLVQRGPADPDGTGGGGWGGRGRPISSQSSVFNEAAWICVSRTDCRAASGQREFGSCSSLTSANLIFCRPTRVWIVSVPVSTHFPSVLLFNSNIMRIKTRWRWFRFYFFSLSLLLHHLLSTNIKSTFLKFKESTHIVSAERLFYNNKML